MGFLLSIGEVFAALAPFPKRAVAIEIGTISSRGQIAIPSDIRDKRHLKDGEKVLFLLEGDALIVKPISGLSWDQITKPLREAKKKVSEEDVPNIVAKLRKG